MPIKLANNASGTLATAISASDTGIVLTTGDGAEFPTLGAGDYFYATITSTQGTQEIVKATARSGDSLTVVRAQEGTSATGFAAGARFELRVTAQSVFDAVGDVVASQVGFTPTGGIAATDVQAALAEVDTEKVAFTRLDDNDGSSLVGFLQAGTNAVATTVQAKLRETVSVKDFGAVGDGVADDTAAISAAFTYANSRKRTGLVATIQHPGCTVVFPGGTYNVSSISTSFLVECNVQSDGAGVLVPADYAGTVFTVGLTASGNLLATADITLPDVYKPTLSSIVIGSTGVRVVNLNASVVRFGRVDYFDRAHHFGGIGQGSVYCDFFFGQTTYARQIVRIIPGTGGWCNGNNFYGGNWRLGGNRVSGQYHLFMDGTAPATAVVGNNFIGTSFEGNGAIYVVYAKNAYNNTFNGAYNETQGSDTSVTVSGSTLTSVAHGLAVDDMVAFFATVLPTGMFDSTPYYVVSTPTADTFTVSLNKGGAAITFSTAGTDVQYRPQSACYFEGSGALTANNAFNDLFSPPSVFLDFVQTGTARNNGLQDLEQRTARVFRPSDIPVFRASNTSSGATTRAVYAAYPTTIDPVTQPTLWTTGLSDQGLMFQTSGAETGRVLNISGGLFYEANNSGVVGQIPNGFRSASYTTLGTTVVPANGRSIVTLTITGAAGGDYVIPMTNNALPDGIAIAWARVSATDTVQICFHNWTGAGIDIAGAQLQAMVLRRFL